MHFMSLKQTYQKIKKKKKILVHFDISLKTTFQFFFFYITLSTDFFYLIFLFFYF